MSAARAALLERFDRRIDAGGPRAVLRSIARNLDDVLNTVSGSALSCPELGMPSRDVLIQLCPDELALVRRLIESGIRRYEPRLERVAVDVIEEPEAVMLRQIFLVRAVLRGGGQVVQLVLVLDHHGRFRVEVQA